MLNELKPSEIKVGEKYFVDEKYYWCGNVTVLADECGEDRENLRGENWVGWRIRIDEEFGGMNPLPVGMELSVGWDTEYSHYSSVRFRPLGSMPEYAGFNGEKDWRRHIDKNNE